MPFDSQQIAQDTNPILNLFNGPRKLHMFCATATESLCLDLAALCDAIETVRNGKENKENKGRARSTLAAILSKITAFSNHYRDDQIRVVPGAIGAHNIKGLIMAGEPLIEQNDPWELYDDFTRACHKYAANPTFGDWRAWSWKKTLDFVNAYDSPETMRARNHGAHILYTLIKAFVKMSQSAYPWRWRNLDKLIQRSILVWLGDIEGISHIILSAQGKLAGNASLNADLQEIERFRTYLAPPFPEDT